MKHVKTPVKMTVWGDLASGFDLLCQGVGPQRVEQMAEVRDVLNQHDALIAQRDALKMACEAVEAWIQCDRGFALDAGGDVLKDLIAAREQAVKSVSAALALVEADNA